MVPVSEELPRNSKYVTMFRRPFNIYNNFLKNPNPLLNHVHKHTAVYEAHCGNYM